MVGHVDGVCGVLSEQHLSFGVCSGGDQLLIERIVSGLGIVFAGDHLVAHVFRNAEDLGGGQTHIQMICTDDIRNVFQRSGGGHIDLLVIREYGSTDSHFALTLCTVHSLKHFQHSSQLCLVLRYRVGNCCLTHGVGQQPAIVGSLTEIGQNGCVKAVQVRHYIRYACRGADHGGLPRIERLGNGVQLQPIVTGLHTHILEELLIFFKDFRPYHIVQTGGAVLGLALVVHAPCGALQAHQLGDSAALHGFQTGVVIPPVSLIALDADRLKGIDGRHELSVVGGQGDIVLSKQIDICSRAVHLGAHGQPADRTIRLLIVVQVAGIEGACDLSRAQVHQVLCQRSRIVQGEAAAGDDVRQLLRTVQQVAVVVHGVEALNEVELILRELLFQPRSKLFHHGAVPQVKGDPDLAVLPAALVSLGLAAAAGGKCCRSGHDTGGLQKRAARNFVHHRMLLTFPVFYGKHQSHCNIIQATVSMVGRKTE